MGKQSRLKRDSPARKSSSPQGGSSSPSASSVSSGAKQIRPSKASVVPSPALTAHVVVSPTSPALPSQSDLRSISDPEILGLVDATPAAASFPATPVAPSTSIAAIPSTDPSLSKTSAQTAPVKVAAGNPEITMTKAPVEEDSWCDLFKGTSKRLQKKGTAFVLPSGESCVKIPDSLIEKHKKSWESFILGQFYSDPPAQGTIHTIVNGIWSKQFKDITVSKMEGNAFLFRIPNVQTRNRVLNQRLWQIEGQTMFVASWEPGVTPTKPELSSAPIWLELRKVPFQFFNDDGLEHIASLVGDPRFLHPDTACKRNLEVAKVFTIIDPRKPLPEAVNVQFDSGVICRVEVSSPWMPPVCSHCKEVGHSIKRCRAAPIKCKGCNSTSHSDEFCPRNKPQPQNVKHRRRRSKTPNPAAKDGDWVVVGSQNKVLSLDSHKVTQRPPVNVSGSGASSSGQATLPSGKGQSTVQVPIGKGKGKISQTVEGKSSSEEEPDSSDVPSDHSEDEDIDLEDEAKFTEVLSQRQQRSWSFDNNYDFLELGKIWVLWHPSVKAVVISKSLQMISYEVQLPDCAETVVISSIYAANDNSSRQSLWVELENLSIDSRVNGKAWIVLGDFNQILHPCEHSIATDANVDSPIRIFKDSLLNSGLVDLNFRGNTFTWWNKRKSAPVAKKLDRILVNDEWNSLFLSSLGQFGEPCFSDHACCEVRLETASPRRKKPFRFYNFC
ncbi:unnamed protein product [Arabidopsis arenosa]|uniref:DUF4283 domain-containing protein n=1 Tax=Arabidopsis arenosa TaxID=38785 RepID=A0A8S1ZS67_ARAAE|nr:unnamed protein product [Arabidopsis arenosa]